MIFLYRHATSCMQDTALFLRSFLSLSDDHIRTCQLLNFSDIVTRNWFARSGSELNHTAFVTSVGRAKFYEAGEDSCLQFSS